MGTSGGVEIPRNVRMAVPTLPLIVALANYDVALQWDTPMPSGTYQWTIAQDAILGIGAATVIAHDSVGVTVRVTASSLITAGKQIHVVAWS